jgi:hypothetical protein
MTSIKVIKDANGNVLNIGDWDYMYQESTVVKRDTDTGGYVVETVNVARNPMPDGAFEAEAEVVKGYDGGLYLTTDPRKDG